MAYRRYDSCDHPNRKIKKCEDCPTMIEVFGNRKRCGPCSDRHAEITRPIIEARYRDKRNARRREKEAARKPAEGVVGRGQRSLSKPHPTPKRQRLIEFARRYQSRPMTTGADA